MKECTNERLNKNKLHFLTVNNYKCKKEGTKEIFIINGSLNQNERKFIKYNKKNKQDKTNEIKNKEKKERRKKNNEWEVK